MKKSLHWHVFIRILLVTAVIIYSNRLFAHWLTTHYLLERIEHNVAVTLDSCQQSAADSNAFFQCVAQTSRGDALSSINEYYVLCQDDGKGAGHTAHAADAPHAAGANRDIQSLPSAPETLSSVCARAKRLEPSVTEAPEQVTPAVQLLRLTIDDDAWLMFTLQDKPNGARMMVRQEDMQHYVQSIWNLRDRILMYVAPVVILMLIMLTVYVTWTVMRPIRQLEASLTKLTSRNLDQPLDLLPPYREFNQFVTVFEQLRARLSQSFLQTQRFAADASHELRTPLTILRGNSERLIAELPTGSEAQVRMRLIGDEIERLIDITEKLLLLSRADANSIRYDMEQVSLSAMVTELALDAMAFQPSLKIHSDIEPDILWTCDRSLTEQLLFNLYTNAAKYNTPDGWIRFTLVRRQDGFVLSIENPCDNIPADLPERAFQRFYRGDASRGRRVDGVGLGLSLCSEIARLHKATLSLQVTERKTVVATLEAQL